MKILQILPSLGTGGAEHFVKELSLCLKRNDISCDVLTLFDEYENEYLYRELKKKGFQIFTLNKKPGFDLKCFVKLKSFIKERNYDVVHSHSRAIMYTIFASITYRKPKYVATIHSEASREAGKSIDKWTRKFMFSNHICTPITISDESEKSFESFYGYPTIMIPNGVSEYNKTDFANLRDNPDQLLFIHPASCQIVKNQKLLLNAFKKLVIEFPNIKLIWLGSNKAYFSLFESLQKLFVKQVHYLGTVDNVRDYLYQADAMCLSSEIEGMPITIIESFSVGCIPLCTPVGGCSNMIKNGINGMLSNDLTINSYYNMLKSFCLLSKEERTQMKNASKKSFSQYTIEECTKQYIKVYKGKK